VPTPNEKTVLSLNLCSAAQSAFVRFVEGVERLSGAVIRGLGALGMFISASSISTPLPYKCRSPWWES
jgi:hypothetical protein